MVNVAQKTLLGPRPHTRNMPQQIHTPKPASCQNPDIQLFIGIKAAPHREELGIVVVLQKLPGYRGRTETVVSGFIRLSTPGRLVDLYRYLDV